MIAEILSVGTELLLGDIVNTNAQYIAKRLADLGILVYHQSVVGDNPKRLEDAYNLALGRADLVITTGGLGLTKDDITKQIAAQFFKRKLIMDRDSMALVPENSVILHNDFGTAPGCIMEEKNKILILLPGPPKEMAPMFESKVVPYLERFQDSVLVSKVLRVIGLGEKLMEDMIKDIIDAQTNPTIAPYVKDGEAILRITARSSRRDEAEKLILPVEQKIRDILGDNVYGVGDTSIEEVVAEMLMDRKLTIAVAESCTGGLLSSKLINYPGISSVFMEGMVTYSNEAKIKRLGVRKETLEKYGAVSERTASEMAEGIAKTANTDIGMSVTGIAGPGGGTADKPVGLVYVGLYIKGVVKTKKLNLRGGRQNIRNRTAMIALDWLRREL